MGVIEGGKIIRTIGGESIKIAKKSITLTATEGNLTFNAATKVEMVGKQNGVKYLNDYKPPEEIPTTLRVTKVIGPDIIKGGGVYDYQAVEFNRKNFSLVELNKLIWNVKYDDSEEFLGFEDEKNKNSYIISDKKIGVKRIHILSEKVIGKKKIKIYPFFNSPSENVCVISHLELPSGVFVWAETKGTGHVFLTVHKENNIYLYTYGRYDDAYMISLGTMGEGVLIRYTNKLAIEYMKKELYRLDCKVYQIKDVKEDDLIEIFDKIWNSSTEKPDNKSTSDSVKEYGRVIDDYDLTGNNCTTKTCDALKEAGTNIFNFDAYLFNKKMYSYKEYFTIPSSLNDFLNEQKETNSDIVVSTEIMKSTYENIQSIETLDKTGSSGETSGSSGDASGSSANSSNSETISSGSSPASSGGIYGSSSN